MDIAQIINQIYNLINAGKLLEAKNICLILLQKYPDHPSITSILGLIYFYLGNDKLAQKYYEHSLIKNPNNALAFHNLGMIFLKNGEIDNAITSFKKALSLNSELAYSYYCLGLSYDIKGKYNEALDFYKKAVNLEPKLVDAYNNMGIIMQKQGQFKEAIDFFKKAIEIEPNYAEVYSNMGLTYREYGMIENSISSYKKSLEINPNLIDAHVNLALSLLLKGDFINGWKEYEWRKKHLPYIFSKPFWEGSDLSSKKIFIYTEQGFGDSIQFIRYIPLVYELGAKIILMCQKELESLFRNIKGIEELLTFGEPFPDFDFHCPLLSLPYIFNTDSESIPNNVPYLFPELLKIKKWSEKVRSDNRNLKVGLSWSGKNHANHISLFSPLLQLSNVTFYSLQKGEAASQVDNSPYNTKIVNLSNEINDFSDTAAIIENLDLVITIDTSVAHLAGALGKEVWTLLTYVPDWRWMLNRKDSPWYPTMRLFRQTSLGNWNSVFSDVLNELTKKRNLVTQNSSK